jgi:ribonuclease HI
MVYAGELEAIHMAITQAKEFVALTTGCRIFTDSQPAIKSIAKPKRQSGQSIIKRILDEIDELHRTNPTYTLHFEWVPGHVGIEGNEKADQAAKEAASQLPRSASERGPWQTTLRSARANAIH